MRTDAESTRVAAVLAHVAVENAHDLDGVTATFERHGFYDDAPWGEHHDGREAVRGYYASLMLQVARYALRRRGEDGR